VAEQKKGGASVLKTAEDVLRQAAANTREFFGVAWEVKAAQKPGNGIPRPDGAAMDAAMFAGGALGPGRSSPGGFGSPAKQGHCKHCKKKLGLTGFRCRCGLTYATIL